MLYMDGSDIFISYIYNTSQYTSYITFKSEILQVGIANPPLDSSLTFELLPRPTSFQDSFLRHLLDLIPCHKKLKF